MPEYDKRMVPSKAHRRDFTARVKRRRHCNDERPYFPVIWTIPSPSVDDFGPRWAADRDFWIAGAKATMDEDAAGSDVRINIRRINVGGGDAAILTSDTRLIIEVGEQIDAATKEDDSPLDEPDFAITYLERGERVYPRITQFGTGGRLEVTLQLVPVRQTFDA